MLATFLTELSVSSPQPFRNSPFHNDSPSGTAEASVDPTKRPDLPRNNTTMILYASNANHRARRGYEEDLSQKRMCERSAVDRSNPLRQVSDGSVEYFTDYFTGLRRKAAHPSMPDVLYLPATPLLLHHPFTRLRRRTPSWSVRALLTSNLPPATYSTQASSLRGGKRLAGRTCLFEN